MPSAGPRTSPSLVRPPGYQAIKAGGADETGMNGKQLPTVHGGRSHPVPPAPVHTATSAAPDADHPGWPARRHGRHCSGSRARVLSHKPVGQEGDRKQWFVTAFNAYAVALQVVPAAVTRGDVGPVGVTGEAMMVTCVRAALAAAGGGSRVAIHAGHYRRDRCARRTPRRARDEPLGRRRRRPALRRSGSRCHRRRASGRRARPGPQRRHHPRHRDHGAPTDTPPSARTNRKACSTRWSPGPPASTRRGWGHRPIARRWWPRSRSSWPPHW